MVEVSDLTESFIEGGVSALGRQSSAFAKRFLAMSHSFCGLILSLVIIFLLCSMVWPSNNDDLAI